MSREGSAPRAPRGLDVAGRAVWREVWRLPRVAASDRMVVESLARAADEAATLRRVLAEQGHVLRRPLQTARGEILTEEEWYPNPASAALRQLGREVAVLSASLGLTPASRKALGLGVPAEEVQHDQLAALRKKHKARFAANKRRAEKAGDS